MPSKFIAAHCPKCHLDFQRRESDVKDAIRKSGQWQCQTCTMVQRNILNASPMGATRVHQGKMLIKTSKGWELESRVIMADILGRPLVDDEMVHHINKNKLDNRYENLSLMLHAEHTIFHHTGTKRSAQTCINIVNGQRKAREDRNVKQNYADR